MKSTLIKNEPRKKNYILTKKKLAFAISMISTIVSEVSQFDGNLIKPGSDLLANTENLLSQLSADRNFNPEVIVISLRKLLADVKQVFLIWKIILDIL